MEIFNFNIKNENTLTRLLIYEIRYRNPDAVKFVADNYVVDNLLMYFKAKDFKGILYNFGHLFLLELLKYFEELEDYEGCKLIFDTIQNHNLLANDILTTR